MHPWSSVNQFLNQPLIDTRSETALDWHLSLSTGIFKEIEDAMIIAQKQRSQDWSKDEKIVLIRWTIDYI